MIWAIMPSVPGSARTKKEAQYIGGSFHIQKMIKNVVPISFIYLHRPAVCNSIQTAVTE